MSDNNLDGWTEFHKKHWILLLFRFMGFCGFSLHGYLDKPEICVMWQRHRKLYCVSHLLRFGSHYGLWVLSVIHDLLVLFTAGNESCPQPQTSEHLAAIEIMKLKHILILQNKIDLVKESQAKEQYEQILAFVQGMLAYWLTIVWGAGLLWCFGGHGCEKWLFPDFKSNEMCQILLPCK